MNNGHSANNGNNGASSKSDLAHSTSVGWVMRGLNLLSVLALIILLVMTFIGVIMRYVFNAPMLGNNEIVQLVSVALVMLAMPLAAHKEAHIRVDVFDRAIGAVGRFIGDVLTRAVSVYILVMLSIHAWSKMQDVAEFNDTTNMLQIPLWPFYGLLILGTVLYAAVLTLQWLDILRNGVTGNE